MHYRGDYYSGCDVSGSFTTVTTTGAPTVLTGTAVCVVAYRLQHGDATGFTCSTAGITLALNCGGRTGWNTWGVRTRTDPTFYACGHDFELVINGGTVGGTCVSGYLVASFSLVNRAGLIPQTFGRSAVVSVGGAVDINWAGVQGCTNATTLSCTTVYSAVKLVDRPFVDACSTVFSVTSVLNNVPGVTAAVTVTPAPPTAAAIADAVWDEPKYADHSTCGTFGYLLDCSISSTLHPEVHGRKLAVTAGGEAGINWARVANCTTAQTLSCTTVYSVVKVVDRPIVDASSVVASVSGAVGSVTVVTDKTGYALSAAGIACVTSAPIFEPANVPGWPMSVCTALGWVAALASNCVTQTASHQTLCNRAVNASIASADLTCTSTIVHRGTFGTVIP